LNVTVPVGALPPEMVAVSKMEPPTGTDGEATVVIRGLARMVTDSPGSAQAVGPTAMLLASPL